uniref:Uncharacterized protein n=1 Tax=Rhabditophanes sp. KR3021 TaxID=114890 RepID=A0AC35U1S6_9BILA
MDDFLDNLPDSSNEIINMRTILQKLSNVYLMIFEANVDDQIKLKLALKELVAAYKNDVISKEFTITPKAHTLICHATEQLGRHGTLMLFSEQGQEALHNIMNKDLQTFQSMPQIKRQLDLLIRFQSLCVVFFDNQ